VMSAHPGKTKCNNNMAHELVSWCGASTPSRQAAAAAAAAIAIHLVYSLQAVVQPFRWVSADIQAK
jgi:hypothetical protein